MTSPAAPLTVGTAGHIDHGKTRLVHALTGVDTDRLPEERERGISLVLGYAPLRLPSGRLVSLVDVPGHERLIRTMVSGATGIDLTLLVVAADDGPMPQTVEHLRVLRALGVDRGVVAISKADLTDPAPAAAAAAELVPGVEVVACSTRTGAGVADVAAALDRAAAGTPGRAAPAGRGSPGNGRDPAVLHIDRVFTIAGAGTVVTGTLWSGTLRQGERLRLLPGDRPVRVRSLQVHDRPVQEAAAGQRVAVNLTGISRRQVAAGEVLAGPGAPVRASHRIDAELALAAPLAPGERVQVHHGTRNTVARVRRRDGRWQLGLAEPLVAAIGDRLVVRRINPPDTLGGGVVVGVGGRPPGSADGGDAVARPAPAAGPARAPDPAHEVAAPAELGDAALELEQRLREAGHEPPSEAELGEAARHLPALRAAGRTVRIGRSMHAHVDAIDAVRARVEAIIDRDGSITLAGLRDELGTSRRYAQALLEHLDAARVTLRRPDDTRVLRRRG